MAWSPVRRHDVPQHRSAPQLRRADGEGHFAQLLHVSLQRQKLLYIADAIEGAENVSLAELIDLTVDDLQELIRDVNKKCPINDAHRNKFKKAVLSIGAQKVKRTNNASRTPTHTLTERDSTVAVDEVEKQSKVEQQKQSKKKQNKKNEKRNKKGNQKPNQTTSATELSEQVATEQQTASNQLRDIEQKMTALAINELLDEQQKAMSAKDSELSKVQKERDELESEVRRMRAQNRWKNSARQSISGPKSILKNTVNPNIARECELLAAQQSQSSGQSYANDILMGDEDVPDEEYKAEERVSRVRFSE